MQVARAVSLARREMAAAEFERLHGAMFEEPANHGTCNTNNNVYGKSQTLPASENNIVQPLVSSTPMKRPDNFSGCGSKSSKASNSDGGSGSGSSGSSSGGIMSPYQAEIAAQPNSRTRFLQSDASVTLSLREWDVNFRAPIIGFEILEQRAKYTVYELNVQNMRTSESWHVFRRYTDFYRLNRKIKELYPDSMLSLPSKRYFKDNFDSNFLHTRQVGLQSFVNYILLKQDLCKLLCVRDFFCFDDPPSASHLSDDIKARYDAMEELIGNLSQEVQEKQAELDYVRAELNLVTSQRDTLLNSLRSECVLTASQAAAIPPRKQSVHIANIAVLNVLSEQLERSQNGSTHFISEETSEVSTIS